jgi:hypothetical protein
MQRRLPGNPVAGMSKAIAGSDKTPCVCAYLNGSDLFIILLPPGKQKKQNGIARLAMMGAQDKEPCLAQGATSSLPALLR